MVGKKDRQFIPAVKQVRLAHVLVTPLRACRGRCKNTLTPAPLHLDLPHPHSHPHSTPKPRPTSTSTSSTSRIRSEAAFVETNQQRNNKGPQAIRRLRTELEQLETFQSKSSLVDTHLLLHTPLLHHSILSRVSCPSIPLFTNDHSARRSFICFSQSRFDGPLSESLIHGHLLAP